MRQTQLLLAIVIVIGSPLAMSQAPDGAATSTADASRQHPADTPPAATRPAPTPDDRGKPAHRPVSAIGRALAGLLQDANRQPSQTTPEHADTATAGGDAAPDGDAADRTQLTAQAEPGGGS